MAGAQPELDAPVMAPTRVGNDADWNLVDAGPEHTCGIRSGEVYCWGYNGVGEVGDGVVSDETCSGGYECHRVPFRVAVPE